MLVTQSLRSVYFLVLLINFAGSSAEDKVQAAAVLLPPSPPFLSFRI